MGSFKINDAEDNLLDAEPAHLYKLYISIRKYMDYKTGISGQERRLSLPYLQERLSYDSVSGRQQYKCSKKTVRSGLKRLQNLGLIYDLGKCVFKCLLATRDESIQKSWGTAGARGVARDGAVNKDLNNLNNKDNPIELGPEQGQGLMLRRGTPPVSGEDIKKLRCTIEQKSHSSRDVEFQKQAVLVLTHLNAKTGRAYRAVPATLKHIVCRLESGVSVEDAKRVIDDRCRAWKNNREMDQYLRPKTLFALSNFENYLGGLQKQVTALPAKPAAPAAKCVVCGAASDGPLVFSNGEKREACAKHSLGFRDPYRYKLIYGPGDPFLAFVGHGQ